MNMPGDGDEFIFANNPEELAQKIQDTHRLMRDRMRDEHHQVLEFCDSLDGDQLNVLSTILHRTSHNPETALRLAGIADALAHQKSNGKFCLCGQNHQAEIDEMLKQEGANPGLTPIPGVVSGEEANRLLSAIMGVRPDPADYAEEATYNNVCAEYNVTPNQPWEEVQGNGRVTCKGCGLEYIHLEDRVLKPPGIDGCHGCQEKSAHG